jgi:tetratricopeptide (TPR) repeat protein
MPRYQRHILIALLCALLSACHTPLPSQNRPYRVVLNEVASAETVAAITRHYIHEEYVEAYNLGRTWSTTQLPDETNVLVALARVKALDDDAQYASALLDVEGRYPTSMLVKLEAGIFLQRRGQRNLATGYFRDLIETKPKTLMERRALAYGLAHWGKIERNLSDRAMEALNLSPSASLDRRVSERALIALGELIEAGDESPVTFYYDGAVAYDLKRYARAVLSLRRALAINPAQIDSLIALGVALDESGQPDEAVKELRDAVEKFPRNAALHTHLGAALLSLRKWQEAEAILTKATELSNPPMPLALANLAEAFLRQNRRDAAFRHAQRATALGPDEPHAWAVLAVVCYESGRPLQQQQALDKLKAISPEAARRLVIRRMDMRAYMKAP